MAQSVELLLDDETDRAVTDEWLRLHDARLPSERRSAADQTHRPHITLYAGDEIAATAEPELSSLVAGLSLTLELGALMLFGPHRRRFVLVHQVVPSVELLSLQNDVGAACGADPTGHFAPGRWSPHVTVARRVEPNQVGPVLTVLTGRAPVAGRRSHVTSCRRWDGAAKRAWLL